MYSIGYHIRQAVLSVVLPGALLGALLSVPPSCTASPPQTHLPAPLLPENPSAASEAARLYAFYVARPSAPGLCVRIARLLRATASPAVALPWHLEAVRLDPATPNLQDLIDLLLQDQKPGEALPYAEILLRREPRNPVFIASAAEIADWAGDRRRAAELSARLAGHSADPGILQKCIDRQLAAGLPAPALSTIRRLLRSHPGDLVLLEKAADTAEWAGDPQASIAYLRRAQRIVATPERGRRILERLISLGKKAEAQEELDQLKKVFPSIAAPNGIAADLADATGLATEALALYDRLPSGDLTAARLSRRAALRFDAGRPSEAKSDAKRLLRHSDLGNPSNTASLFSAFLTCARVEAQSGNTASATAFFRKARSFLEHASLPEDSRSQLLESLHWVWADAARSGSLAGDEESSLLFLAASNPGDIHLLLRLAELARQRSDAPAACRLLESALHIRPGDPGIEHSLAESLLAAGASDTARPYLERCLDRNPEDSFVRDALLSIARMTGDTSAETDLLWASFLTAPGPETSRPLLPLLQRTGRRAKALEIMLSQLLRDPFDAETEAAYLRTAKTMPFFRSLWERMRPVAIDTTYSVELNRLSARLASAPDDLEAIERRAQVHLWRNAPAAALPDMQAVIRLVPQDPSRLRRAIETAEWAGRTDLSDAWRRFLSRLDPADATNTLRLAQKAGWSSRQHEAWPLYARLLAIPASPTPELLISASPIAVWAGRNREARDLHQRLSAFLPSMSPLDRREYERQAEELRLYGPSVTLSALYRHDTESIREHRIRLDSRHSVGDRLAQNALYDRLLMSQEAHGNRNFEGAAWSNEWILPTPDGRQWKIRLCALDNRSDGDVRLLLPSVTRSWRRHGRDTDLTFSEDPVFDTPETLRRGMFLRQVAFSHTRPLSGPIFIGFRGGAGEYTGKYHTGSCGIFCERRSRRDAGDGWRYQYSLNNTTGDGGNIFYTPRHLGTHRLSWFGNDRLGSRRRSPLTLTWELEAGRENGVAGFHGARVALLRRYLKSWQLRVEGALLHASRSHFGGDKSGYGLWQWSFQLEHDAW